VLVGEMQIKWCVDEQAKDCEIAQGFFGQVFKNRLRFPEPGKIAILNATLILEPLMPLWPDSNGSV
jgi:hypothetical protein